RRAGRIPSRPAGACFVLVSTGCIQKATCLLVRHRVRPVCFIPAI
ncbi:unnamed protein product, partial [Ectocarpus fasciculatus]